MSGYTRQQAVLWQNAVNLADRGFRIAMVRLGWDEVRGEKTMLRNPPAGWQLADPFPSTQVKAKIDEGCNAYLWRLPDGWWVVDADTAELVAEYTELLGAPDVVTPRGAHWIVDAPARSRHKLDTGVRGFYGPGSHYLGPDGYLREYVGAVPQAPRALPAGLRRPVAEYGQLTPGEPMAIEPGAAQHTVEKFRSAWLASVHGGRHFAVRDYLPQLARLLRAEGTGWDEVGEQLRLAVEAHPEYDPAWFDEGSAGGVLHFALAAAASTPWELKTPDGLEARFAPPDPGQAPAAHADWGDDDDPDAFTYDEFDKPIELEKPTHGAFGGERPVLYPDKVHWFQGESGSGKTWAALAVAVEVADEFGERVWIIDYENSRAEFAGRLKGLGISRDGMRRVTYTDGTDITHAELRGRMDARRDRYGLVLIDGVSSALTAAGKSGNDAQEFGAWFDQIPGRAERMVICIDHVTKATDDRKGMAIGTQAKKGRPGVTFEVRCAREFKRGVPGVVDLVLQKDRYGGLPIARGERLRLNVESSADGLKVRLSASSASAEFMAVDNPHEALFSALYADGLTASCSADEFAKAARLAGAKVRNNERTKLRDDYMKYWADRENEGQPVDNPVDNFVP